MREPWLPAPSPADLDFGPYASWSDYHYAREDAALEMGRFTEYESKPATVADFQWQGPVRPAPRVVACYPCYGSGEMTCPNYCGFTDDPRWSCLLCGGACRLTCKRCGGTGRITKEDSDV